MPDFSVKTLSLPTGSYSLPEPRASVRRLVNCYSEVAPNVTGLDAKSKDPPVILRRTPGIVQWNQTGNLVPGYPPVASVRGMFVMAGTLYAVVGDQLGSYDQFGNYTFLGTGIPGSGRVYMTGNGYCLVIILPGLVPGIGYTWDLADGLLPITASTFVTYGAAQVGFIDSYIVFLQANGRGFYNDDGQITSGTGPITFNNFGQLPREFGTDPFVGMQVLNRVIWCFGELTSECYIDAGNTAGSPFASSPNNFMELGCANGNTVVKQNQTIFWIANDLTVRCINNQSGITPTRVSNHAIEAILQDITITDAYSMAYSLSGHLMVVFVFPTAQRTLVYDCITTEWHEMSSYGIGYWRPFCIANAYGKQLIGDSQPTAQIGYLDPGTYTEFGNTLVATWIHQPVYAGHMRLRHRRLEIVLGTGEAPLTGQGSEPLITLQMSDDGGHTWRTMPARSLGSEGKRATRAVWYNLGTSRERVYQFNLSDPVELWLTDVTLDALPI